MTRWQVVLLALWLAELVGIAYWWNAPLGGRLPPETNLEALDPFAADEIRLLARQCDSAAQWRRLGEILMAFGAFRESEACHRQAAQQDPTDGQHVYEWAFALERLGLLDEANEQYRRAAALEPTLAPDCWYFIGRNLERLERPDAASAAFESAGRVPGARYERARILARAGRFEEARLLADALGREYPRRWPTVYLRYRIARLAGEAGQRDLFADTAALGIGPLPTPLSGPWQRLSMAKHEVGASHILAQARAAGDDLLAFEPQLRQVYERFWLTSAADLLADLHFQKRELAEAERLLAGAVNRNGPSAHLLNRLGVVHEELGNRPGALEAWMRAARLGSAVELQNLHSRLASIHEQDGQKHLAKRHAALANFGAGVEMFWLAQYSAAQKSLRSAVGNDPTHVGAWFYLGEACRLLSDNKEAQLAYACCLALHPQHGWARRGLKLARRDK